VDLGAYASKSRMTQGSVPCIGEESSLGYPGALHVVPLKAAGAGTLMLSCDPSSFRNSAKGCRVGRAAESLMIITVYQIKFNILCNIESNYVKYTNIFC